MGTDSSNGNAAPAMKGLDPSVIAGLMSSGRTRGIYGKCLLQFVEESDEPGINPREVWPLEFSGKTVEAMYQSFNGAKNKAGLEDVLTIRRDKTDLYILHNERAAVVVAELAAAAEKK